jgi:hypothetical protein
MSTATVKERRQFSNFSSHSEQQCRSYPNDLGRIDAGLHWGHRGRHGREYLSQHDDQLRYSTPVMKYSPTASGNVASDSILTVGPWTGYDQSIVVY